jgi:uncharacterized protein (DUF2062 family)
MRKWLEIGETSSGEKKQIAPFRAREFNRSLQKAMLMIMLVAAVMVSLAFGVLLAYGLCYGMFQVFRIHSQSVRQARVRSQLVVER